MIIFKVLLLLSLTGCAAIPPAELTNLPAGINQVLLVQPSPTSIFQAHLTAWQKNSKGWALITSSKAVVGRNGIAPYNEKKEGDGRTPSGIFSIKSAFGYEPSIETCLNYRQVNADDIWIDDPKSPFYNQWAVLPVSTASSFEYLRRKDVLYRLAAIIEYNTEPVIPGAGSAIFLHVWKDFYHPTAGCVAIPYQRLKFVIRWLDKNSQPTILLLS